jgi:AcrR family transcriptional regulator
VGGELMPRATRGGPERILAAAFTCFGRYGYKRVSLEQIAQELGISRAARSRST